MKKRNIMSLFLTCLFLLCGLCLPVGATSVDLSTEINAPYIYPITPEMPEWLNLVTHEEKVAACQIPADILHSLTTEALIKTIIDYPLAVDMYVHNSMQDGYLVLKDQFNGIEELSSRVESPILMKNEIARAAEGMPQSNLQLNSEEAFDLIFVEDLSRLMYENEMASLLLEPTPFGLFAFVSATVKTPRGTNVSVYKGLTFGDHNTTQAEANAAFSLLAQLTKRSFVAIQACYGEKLCFSLQRN